LERGRIQGLRSCPARANRIPDGEAIETSVAASPALSMLLLRQLFLLPSPATPRPPAIPCC
jgi:hypothetical protein